MDENSTYCCTSISTFTGLIKKGRNAILKCANKSKAVIKRIAKHSIQAYYFKQSAERDCHDQMGWECSVQNPFCKGSPFILDYSYYPHTCTLFCNIIKHMKLVVSQCFALAVCCNMLLLESVKSFICSDKLLFFWQRPPVLAPTQCNVPVLNVWSAPLTLYPWNSTGLSIQLPFYSQWQGFAYLSCPNAHILTLVSSTEALFKK